MSNFPFKLSLRLSASGIALYVIYLLLRLIPVVHTALYANQFVLEIVRRGEWTLLLASIALACTTIYVHRNNLPKLDKAFIILANVAAWPTLWFVLNGTIFNPFWYDGGITMLETWQWIYMFVMAICVLCKLSMMEQQNEKLPKWKGVVLLLLIILSLLAILMMVIAGIYVLCTGKVLGLHTTYYLCSLMTWILAIFLVLVALPLSTKNAHTKFTHFLKNK